MTCWSRNSRLSASGKTRSKTESSSECRLVQAIVKPLKDAMPVPALQVDEGSFQRF